MHAAIQILQGKWVLHIVRGLLDGPRGFNDLSRAVGGCNPATLTQRLEQLERLGLVTKTVQSYMPPRTTYALTPAGVALHEVVDAIDAWGNRYLRQPSQGVPDPAEVVGADAERAGGDGGSPAGGADPGPAPRLMAPPARD